MPKGVEHRLRNLDALEMLAVKVDQMPKGVEHNLVAWSVKVARK